MKAALFVALAIFTAVFIIVWIMAILAARRERQADLRSVQQARRVAQRRADWPFEIIAEHHDPGVRRDMEHRTRTRILRERRRCNGKRSGRAREHESFINVWH